MKLNKVQPCYKVSDNRFKRASETSYVISKCNLFVAKLGNRDDIVERYFSKYTLGYLLNRLPRG